MSSLPTVELIDGDLYWIKALYKNEDRWTVARWQHGYWWDIEGQETTPRVIAGPIPRPAESEATVAVAEQSEATCVSEVTPDEPASPPNNRTPDHG